MISRVVDAFVLLIFMLYTNEVVVLPVDGQYFQEQRMGEYPGRLIRGAIGFGVLLGYLFFRFKNTLQSLSVFFSVAGAILLFGFASMFWSVDPAYTVQKAISYGFCIIYPALLIRAFGLSESLWLIWAVGAVILIASAIFAVIGSDFALMKGAHEGLWRGFFSHKNKFGPFALWMLLLSIALPPTDKVRQALVLTVKVVAVVSIVFSGSATALMLLVLSYSVYVVFKILLQSNVTPILGSLSIVFAIVTGVTLIATFTPMVLELMGRDLTLTGRVPLWQAAIPHTLAHPFGFGFGIGASEAALTDIRTATGWDVAPNVHNGFIELALSLGWAAVVVFYSWLASNFIFITSTRKLFFQYSAVIAAIAAGYFGESFTESRAGANLQFPLFLIYYLALSRTLLAQDATETVFDQTKRKWRQDRVSVIAQEASTYPALEAKHNQA